MPGEKRKRRDRIRGVDDLLTTRQKIVARPRVTFFAALRVARGKALRTGQKTSETKRLHPTDKDIRI